MAIYLKTAGTILILLAFMHVIFPRYFNWKKELSAVSLINRQMMYVHTFFISFTVLLMGVLCIGCTDDLINTSLGKKLSLGLSFFWGLRLIFQVLVYSPSLWRGKLLETFIHILFLLLWIYFTALFSINYAAD